MAVVLLGGCAPSSQQQIFMQPASVETVEYYPFQVKGYQNSYPKKSIVVVPVKDARDFKDVGGVSHEPQDGRPAIGVVLDQTGKIDQRLYGSALEPLVQRSIAQSAQEAGMVSSTSELPLRQALAARGADYVLAAEITRCWVNKHRGPDNQAGPTWSAAAEVALSVAIYKPPFDVAFWEGESEATYADPSALASGNPDDETEIYDRPGEVLSVAVTRAVAGIFKRENLRELIQQDAGPAH